MRKLNIHEELAIISRDTPLMTFYLFVKFSTKFWSFYFCIFFLENLFLAVLSLLFPISVDFWKLYIVIIHNLLNDCLSVTLSWLYLDTRIHMDILSCSLPGPGSTWLQFASATFPPQKIHTSFNGNLVAARYLSLSSLYFQFLLPKSEFLFS